MANGHGYAPLNQPPHGQLDSYASQKAQNVRPSQQKPHASNVLQALVEASESELVALLAALERRRPGMLRRALTLEKQSRDPHAVGPSPREESMSISSGGSVREFRRMDMLTSETAPMDQPPRSPDASTYNRVSTSEGASSQLATRPRISVQPPSLHGQEPLIQFSTFIYYCHEDEGCMNLDVMRAGDLSRPSAVNFRTIDLSAKAGKHYQFTRARLTFAPDEDSGTVQVPIIENSEWDTTLEFGVELDGHNGLENAQLGRYLWYSRVKIIDNDSFPTNKYKAQLHDGANVKSIGPIWLFIEYVKFSLTNPIVMNRSIKCVVLDQLHNLYGFLHLFVNVYLVDRVLNPASPDEDLIFIHSKPLTLLLIVGFLLVPFLFLHYLDDRKAQFWGVGGSSASLQERLMRKFLNYDAASRMKISSGDLVMAMTRDSMLLASLGYWNVLAIVSKIGDLCLMLSYQFIAPVVFGKPFSWIAFAPLVSFPICMAIILKVRNDTTGEVLMARNHDQNILVTAVEEVVGDYWLIADFSQRENFMHKFAVCIQNFAESTKQAGRVLKNNAYFAKWLSCCALVGWIFFGGIMVIEGDLSLGMFLANVNIFAKIGAAWGGIYQLLIEIMTIFPALENVTIAMNLPTDVATRMALNRIRRTETATMREKLREDEKDPRLPLDRMPIFAADVTFSHTSMCTEGTTRSTTLNHSGAVDIQQGELVVFLGPSGGGKGTLLKFLAGNILPDPFNQGGHSGKLFVPAHLRVLHVPLQALFFDGSLLANLTFGVAEGDVDGTPERVARICRKLGVSQEVLCHLDEDGGHPWGSVFSTTQCQLLSLARALIANPEILCIHHPTRLFDEVSAVEISTVLRAHVDGRGIVQMAASSTRRPRTLILSSARKAMLGLTDRVYHVSREKGIRSLSPSEYENIDPTAICH